MKCDECGTEYEQKMNPYYKAGILIGTYPMLFCNKCKETVIEGTVCKEMEKDLKKRNLWGKQIKIEC
jgi:hypothetical protein